MERRNNNSNRDDYRLEHCFSDGLLEPNLLHDSLVDTLSTLLQREQVNLHSPPPELARRYRRLSLREVFLNFSGHRPPVDPVHRAIAALASGDRLELRSGLVRWELVDRNGTVVGQLARGFQGPPPGLRCAFATVLAIVNWDRARSELQYRTGLLCATWEVVVPELVFEPDL